MSKVIEHKVYEFDDFRIDVDHLMLSHQGSEIPLVPKAVETLVALIEHRGKIVSKDELLDAVWPDTVVEESNLFLYLSVLRKTLGTQKNGSPYVETLRRRGYRFNGEVHLVRQEVENQLDAIAVDSFEQSRAKTIAKPGQIYFVKDWNRKTESRETSYASSAVPALEPVESPNSLMTAENESGPAELSPAPEITERPLEDSGVASAEPPTKAEHPKRFRTSYLIAASLAAILLSVVVAGSYYWRSRPATATNASPRVIAILPFRPLVDENRDEILEFGMADTLITRLGNNSAIRVLPLSSVRTFNGSDRDAINAGKVLDVEAVLDSSLQRSGDRILVNVNLRRVADGTTIWVESFNEKFADRLIVQEAIATRIASALALNLTSEERTRLQKRYTSNPEAQDYYNRARYNELKITEEALRQAIGFYEQAIKADPNYALAYAHMATAYRSLAHAGFARLKEVLAQVEWLVRKALEIDESLGEGYFMLAWLDNLNGDPASAETNYKRAIKLNPKDFQAHRGYAGFLSNMKRHEEAVAEARQASELSPMTPIVLALESQILRNAGKVDEAVLKAKNALEFEPNLWVGHLHLGAAYHRQKRYAEAIVELQKAKELAPGSYVPLSSLGRVYAEMGDKERVIAILKELEQQQAKKGHVPLHSIAWFYHWLGQNRKALDLLERSLEERDGLRANLTDKGWDNLRSEPRFQNILRQLNLDK
ncbi:MAG: winged helix-turn-helix domain-containing protein [Pyrinomonadaceae bacterium]|nr:winged helix-turn-helix domain-containing protein [Pyrinomonadaceae bacterium]